MMILIVAWAFVLANNVASVSDPYWPSDCDETFHGDACLEQWELNRYGCIRTKEQVESGITCEEFRDE